MADLKFHCPECDQRLAVDESAAGMQIDCPQCRTALIIPASSSDPVKLVSKGRIPALAGAADSAYEELERKQNELSSALEEAAKLRAESERAKSELVRLRQDLAAASDRSITPAVSPVAERMSTENAQLRAKLADAEAARELLADRAAALEARPAPAPPATDANEVAIWKQQIEVLRGEMTRSQEALTAVTAERDRLKVETVHATEALRDFDTAKATLVRREARIDELTASEAAILRERDELRAELTEALAQTQEAATARQQREAQLEELQRQLAASVADREAALLHATEHQELLGNLESVNLAALRQADEFRAQIAQLSEALHARTLERDQASQALADRDDSVRTASQTMAAAKKEMDRLNQEASALEHEHAQLRGHFDEVSEEAREVQLRVDSLLDDLHAREREVGDGRELVMRTTAERDAARQKLAEKEDELRESVARLETTHRYAETKVLETQQDAEAKVEAAERDAETRIANAQRTVEELLAAKHDLESKFAATEAMVADGTARFEALRQASDSERGSAAREREDLRHRVEQLLGDLHARENDCAEAARKFETHAAVQEALQSQLGAKSDALSRIETELEAARREASEQRETARQEAAGAKRDADARLENVVSEHETKLAAQREAAAQAARAADENRDRLERELSESNKHADALEGRISSLQADLQRSGRSVEQTRAELHIAQQNQKKAAEELLAKEKQIAELLVQIAAAQEAEKDVRSRAADAEKEFRTRLDAAEKQIEAGRRAAADRDQFAEESKRAKADLVAYHETVRGAREERDSMRLNVDSMELQLEESLDQIHAGEAERDALKAELEAVRAGLERAKQHVNVLQSRRDQMREEITRLKMQLGHGPDSAS